MEGAKIWRGPTTSRLIVGTTWWTTPYTLWSFVFRPTETVLLVVLPKAVLLVVLPKAVLLVVLPKAVLLVVRTSTWPRPKGAPTALRGTGLVLQRC